MADIKQAAEWLNAGETVTRGDDYRDGYFPALHWGPNGIEDENGEECMFTLSDLLAGDWEIVAVAS